MVGDRRRQCGVGVDRDDLLPLRGHVGRVGRGLTEVQETKVVVHLSNVGVELRGDQPLLLCLDRVAKVELPAPSARSATWFFGSKPRIFCSQTIAFL